jgi:hypothetical protein
MVAVRGAGHETRGIARKDYRQRFRYNISKLVFRNFVPNVEKEVTTGFQYAARFLVTLNPVGKEHYAKLAGHNIKALIRKRQRQSISLLIVVGTTNNRHQTKSVPYENTTPQRYSSGRVVL